MSEEREKNKEEKMALNNTSKGIHASCMDYLTMEMVAYVIRTSSNLSDEAIQYKLEHLGFEVGQRLMELYTRDRKRFKDNLEAVKFICKEFWIELYQKQIDNLRTNHKVYFIYIFFYFFLFSTLKN